MFQPSIFSGYVGFSGGYCWCVCLNGSKTGGIVGVLFLNGSKEHSDNENGGNKPPPQATNDP